MNFDNIRIDEINAFLLLIPEVDRHAIVNELQRVQEHGDLDAGASILFGLWHQVVAAHVEAAAEHRFDEIILNMANPFDSVN